ncbi:MAG: lipopolysaccharide heptosyltransferase II [Candidatus Omnitrophica bacterium]|nr:lipopolysaccharide heptosyltransferase II [Candidatus Omnitrophota bacterium]
MNVLQILPELNIGGVERGTVDLARYLMANDHKAVVVSGGGRLVRELDMIGARHYRLPVGKKSLITMAGMVGKLCEIIKRENIDIVHARSRVPGWIAFFACKITKRPFITTAHGYYKNIFTSQVMGWSKFVIAASHVIARHMIDGFKIPRSKIKFIPRGVDLNRFEFGEPKEKRIKKRDLPGLARDGGFTVGVISRLTPIKGHIYLIKALSVVSRMVPKLKLLIVGEPSPGKEGYKRELELLVRRLGLSQVVEFTGWKEDIPEVMSQLDLLVLPSVTQEAFGRVIIEAQACGVPVVATRIGGIVDLIEDGVNGLLVTPEDIQALTESMLKIYKDPESAQRLAVEARRNVEEKFSLDKMAQRTVDLYKETIESRNILVIKVSALGDVILSMPSLGAIRSKYPNATIKVLVGLESRQVFKGCPYIDEVIVCDFKGRDRSMKSLWRLGALLRNSNFDMVIDLQNNRRSHILAFLSLAPLRFGYSNGKLSFLLNKKVEGPKDYIDPVSHQFRTLNLAGIKSDNKRLKLWPQEEEEEWAEGFIKANWVNLSKQRLIGISPRASRRWSSKNWPVQNVALLCDELARRFNTRVVITGTKDDIREAHSIRSMAKSKPIIAAGKTDILQLAALIKRCSIFITTDSAAMHIASCVKTPFIALFGPTEHERHAPVSAEYTVIAKELKCRPCYRPTCGKGYKCMKKISVEDVMNAVERYLGYEPR